MHWDDLRYVLAVAEEGSMNRAARRLEVNHATVLRRIARLETEIGRPLFVRQANTYLLTSAGQSIVGVAADFEARLALLDERAGAEVTALGGNLRVTTTDSLMVGLLADPVAEFQREHPGVALEFSITNHLLDLSRRHADVAIRPTRAPPQTLHAVRVADLAFGLYVAREYPLAGAEVGDPRHRWLVIDDSVMGPAMHEWLRRQVSDTNPMLRADSFVAIGSAAVRGLGLALLPCFMGDGHPELVRVQGPLDEVVTGLWVLRRPESVRVARVAAFCDAMTRALVAQADRLSGLGPSARQIDCAG
ncbi:MAG: LysR family transcriptional regulator [Burkholderiaceae bacterium]